MVELLSNTYSLLLLGDIVTLYLYHMMHSSFYKKRTFFEHRKILVFIIYTISCFLLFVANLQGIALLNLSSAILLYVIPLYICYKVNNFRGIIYFWFYIAIQGSIEIVASIIFSGMTQTDTSNMSYEWMDPISSGVMFLLYLILARIICIIGNKDGNRKLDKAAFPYVGLPIFSIVFFMVDGSRFIKYSEKYNLSQYTEMIVILVFVNILVFAFLEKHTELMKQELEARQNEYKSKSDADIMALATKTMRERLAISENIMQQDRAMRHDRRHFEALLLSLLQEGKTEEALVCLSDRLKQEPHPARRYCENTTINAAITHYVSVAERENIKVEVATTIPSDLDVDEMQLAITVSNLIENAIHACMEVPAEERFISIIAKYKSQLLLEVVNSCKEKVKLDEEGHPFSDEEDHGIGTRSVLAFVTQTNSEIRYIAEDHIFKVRMII